MRTEELDSCARKVPAVSVFICKQQVVDAATAITCDVNNATRIGRMLRLVRQSDRGRRERTSTGSSQAAPPATPARASGPHRRRHSACAPVSNLALMTSPSTLRLLRRSG